MHLVHLVHELKAGTVHIITMWPRIIPGLSEHLVQELKAGTVHIITMWPRFIPGLFEHLVQELKTGTAHNITVTSPGRTVRNRGSCLVAAPS